MTSLTLTNSCYGDPPKVAIIIDLDCICFPGFLDCVGIINGTLIPIMEPSEFPEQYVSRKGFFAINVQVIIQ